MLVTCSIGCMSHQLLILYMVAINIYNRTKSNRGTGDPLHLYSNTWPTAHLESWSLRESRELGCERTPGYLRERAPGVRESAGVHARESWSAHARELGCARELGSERVCQE